MAGPRRAGAAAVSAAGDASGLLRSRADWEQMAVHAGATFRPLVQVVSERAQIEALLRELGRVTTHCLTSLHAGTPPEPSRLAASVAADRALMDRGVQLRLVYPQAFLADRSFADYAAEIAECGAQVRFADGVPHRLIVSDARRAVVPLDNRDLGVGACTTTSAQLVGGLAALADTLFRRGRPLESAAQGEDAAPTQMELRLLAMLSSGVPDGLAARRLAVSERTFRRHVTQLLAKLGAESRFQAGVRAVERGWL